MKKIIMVLGMAGMVTFGVHAQESVSAKDNYPYWTISKEVQRLQYKDVEFTPALVTTGDAVRTRSKEVHKTAAMRSSERKGKVTMTGTPSWVISKGVQRLKN